MTLTSRLRPRLAVESLEARDTPAVTVAFAGGNLTVIADHVGRFIQINPNGTKIAVVADGRPMGSYAVTGNLTVRGGNGGDAIQFNTFTGPAIPGNVMVDGGNGNDLFQITGKIGGMLTVLGGNGDDEFDYQRLAVGGPITRYDGGLGTNQMVDFGFIGQGGSQSTFAGTALLSNTNYGFDGPARSPAATTRFNNLVFNNANATFDPVIIFDADVTGNMIYTGGARNDTVFFFTESDIGGELTLLAGGGANFFDLDVGVSVGGGVTYLGGNGEDLVLLVSGDTIGGTVNANLGDGDNVLVVVDMTINGGLTVTGGNGGNTFVMDNSTIGGDLNANFGNGLNFFDIFTGSVGGRLNYRGGSGEDNIRLFVQPTGTMRLDLGGGNGTVDLSGIADYTGNATVDFGVGPGTKMFEAPGTISGSFTLLNYP